MANNISTCLGGERGSNDMGGMTFLGRMDVGQLRGGGGCSVSNSRMEANIDLELNFLFRDWSVRMSHYY